MAYRKVYFRIRTDCYSSGWTSDAERTAFKEESRRLFQELGWAVTFGHNGSCDTAAKYPFYLEQKFYDAGRLETRTLSTQEAEALNYEDGYKVHGEGYTLYVDGYNSLETIQSYLDEWEATKRAYAEQ